MLTSKKPTYVTLPGGAGGGSKKLKVLPGVEIRLLEGASNEPGVDGEIGVADEWVLEIQNLIVDGLVTEVINVRKNRNWAYWAFALMAALAIWGWCV